MAIYADLGEMTDHYIICGDGRACRRAGTDSAGDWGEGVAG
jgi:hypothetical protein